MSHMFPHIQLLHANVDEHGKGEYRILVNHKSVRYLSIDSGLYARNVMTSASSLIPLLPPLPCGVWNTGRIAANPTSGDPYFASVAKTDLPGITKTWNSTYIDHLELSAGEELGSNVYEATCAAKFGSSTVAVKLARFACEVSQLEHETEVYGSIEGKGIGPAFLGHLTEEQRVIGFVMERIVDSRPATPADLPLCRETLSKLHRLGIKHGDINKNSFVIHGGKATLINFHRASRGAGPGELEDELNGLKERLKATSTSG